MMSLCRQQLMLVCICLISCHVWQLGASSESSSCVETLEETDAVSMLHARKADDFPKANTAIVTAASTDDTAGTVTAAFGPAFASVVAPGILPPLAAAHANATGQDTPRAKNSALLQLMGSGSYGAAYGYGLGAIMFVLFFGLLLSCAAIVTTKDLMVFRGAEAGQDRLLSAPQLSERRSRLMGALRSVSGSPFAPSTFPAKEERPPLSVGQRQVVVPRPLDGDKLGVNLTEENLQITSFSDPRGEAFGFQVGERIIRVNGVPVFQQNDFMHVLSGAIRQNHWTGQPILIDTINDGTMPPVPQQSSSGPFDVCGAWDCDSGETITIRRGPGHEQQLMVEVKIGSQGAIVGGLLNPDGAELHSYLQLDGMPFGEIRLGFNPDTQTMDVHFRAADEAGSRRSCKAARIREGTAQQTLPRNSPSLFTAQPPATLLPVTAQPPTMPADMVFPMPAPNANQLPAAPPTSMRPSTQMSLAAAAGVDTGVPSDAMMLPAVSLPQQRSVVTMPAPATLLPAYSQAPQNRMASAPPAVTQLPPTAAPQPPQTSMAAAQNWTSSMARPAAPLQSVPEHAPTTMPMEEIRTASMSPVDLQPADRSPNSFAAAEYDDIARRAKELFDRLDRDGSGAVSREEFEAALRGEGETNATEELLPVAPQAPQDSYAASPSMLAFIKG
eukprot:gb/GFBE01076322.1/.p1 GENE.gb/GFBE01076322.1/~~gb/GFBE01076322.1/.p1  ORF type:complete len:670 (+),score=114.95 gb/GFBE01076322.1/:1-2010(+)